MRRDALDIHGLIAGEEVLDDLRCEEAHLEHVARLEPELLGRGEARRDLVGAAGCTSVQHVEPVERRAERTIHGSDRGDVVGVDDLAIRGGCDEDLDRSPRRLRHLWESSNLVEIEAREREDRVSPAHQEHIPRVLGLEEPRIRRVGATRAGERAEHHATGDTREERQHEPRAPAPPELGAEAQPDGGHERSRTRSWQRRWPRPRPR